MGGGTPPNLGSWRSSPAATKFNFQLSSHCGISSDRRPRNHCLVDYLWAEENLEEGLEGGYRSDTRGGEEGREPGFLQESTGATEAAEKGERRHTQGVEHVDDHLSEGLEA